MPDLGFAHPIVVHFAIALGLVGVGLRWLALGTRARFAGPSACLLLALAAAAAVVAARSGEDASALAEPIPGVAAPVAAHRAWGRRARTLLVGTALLEGLALARPRAGVPAALLGLAAAVAIVEAGRHGGDLVYRHAAGVGVRSGDPADVGGLLLAGLLQQSNLDDRSGRAADAAALVDLAASRFPSDVGVQLLDAASLLRRRQPAAALARLEGLALPPDPQLRYRRAWLTADALEAVGRGDAASLTLQHLRGEFPDDARLARRIARSSGPAEAIQPSRPGVVAR